ncbi:MAG: hypothetical protein IH991_21230 [Planctomycetes bacterium]|nr:hypothetical protein [Planctomycetota bacterium]
MASVATDIDLSIQKPGGGVEPLRLERRDEFGLFQFEATDTSGIYRVEIGPPLVEERLFAVNVKPAESDLTKLERDELAEKVFPGVRFAYLTQWQNSQAATPVSVRHRGDLHY